MNKYKQVIVVEGKHDEQKIKSIYPGIDCITTGGSEISEETINLIFQTSLKREVILFLDPDTPGKKITNRILESKGNYQIAFIDKSKAISRNGNKVGIEHAKREDIIASLESCFTIDTTKDSITIIDLMRRNLINGESSATNRQNLCKSLNIPVVNGKALCKTLNYLGINLGKVDDILERQ